MLEKMGRADAMAQIDRLDVKIDQMDNKFEYGMPPAMLQRLENFNKMKADKEEVVETLRSKLSTGATIRTEKDSGGREYHTLIVTAVGPVGRGKG